MRSAWWLVSLGALVVLLAGCPISGGGVTQTRIVSFDVAPSSVPRGAEVRLEWVVQNPGSRPGVDACSVSRRPEGEPPQDPSPVPCSGELTEVPPAGSDASYVRYQLNVLKSPYDAADPYVTSVVTVDLEPGGPGSVTSVSIDQSDVALGVGEQVTLSATVTAHGGASTAVTWSSSDPSVLSIDSGSGVATGSSEGSASITAASVADPTVLDTMPVTVAFGPFGAATVVADTLGMRQRYNREFVAIDAERAFYSRTRALDGTLLIGSVTVLERSASGTWTSQATLDPPPWETYRGFGDAIEAHGSTAVVLGYRRASIAPETYESVLNVFESGASGSWSRGAMLLEGEGIGTSIASFPNVTMALASDTLVVGLPRTDDGASPSEVRVYGRNVGGPSAWGVAATFAPPATLSDIGADFFGSDVAISADGRRVAVASSFQSDNACLGDTVSVYERDGASPEAWALIDTVGTSELVGCSTYVAIDDETLAVTRIGDTVASLRVFQRGAGSGGPNDYSIVRMHAFTVPTYEDVFVFLAATSIRLRQDTIALGMVGVHCDGYMPGAPCAPGSIQIVRRDAGGPGAWGVEQVLQGDPAYADQGFGTTLDLSADGHYLVVGSSPDATTDPSRGGEVFVFER